MAQKAPIHCFYCWTLNRNILNFDLMLDGLWKTKHGSDFRVRVSDDNYHFWDEDGGVEDCMGSISEWDTEYPSNPFERWLTTYYELTEVSYVERLLEEYES